MHHPVRNTILDILLLLAAITLFPTLGAKSMQLLEMRINRKRK